MPQLLNVLRLSWRDSVGSGLYDNDKWSTVEDLIIRAKTVRAVANPRGVYWCLARRRKGLGLIVHFSNTGSNGRLARAASDAGTG